MATPRFSVGCGHYWYPLKMSTKVLEEWGVNFVYLPEQMQKLNAVDELTSYDTPAVETGAELTRLVAGVGSVADATESVANLSKCIAGMSTVFHLVALCAQRASMCAEANGGKRVLPVALGRIVILSRFVLLSLADIMKTSRRVNQLGQEFVLNVLRQGVYAMDITETQLLRGRGSQVMNADHAKEVERRIKELEPPVLTVRNTSRIFVVGEEFTELKKDQGISCDRPHRVRPSLSPFFSGRTKEFNTLTEMLGKRGSALIIQYGGVGKTELMIAFADRVERDEQVLGEVFWVKIDGDEKDVLGSLARVAEKLTGEKMSDEERWNANLVIAALKQGLNEREGRWLLCLDNADDRNVSGILNDVCGLEMSSRGNGWVVVKSRQGQPQTWERMETRNWF